MDPQQPPSPPHRAVADFSSKLRLMCSYGGQIVSRPRTNTLSYLGGETRILSVNPTTINNLSAFVSHLSTTLSIKLPFTVKYQLPHLRLDSLISISSDDDLQFMLGEHIRLSASASSRMRLFIFFSKPEIMTIQHVIHHPNTEAWFVDALKSAEILQKRQRDCLVGYDGEAIIGENEAKTVADLGANAAVSFAESIFLETSSSFGSSSSSTSVVNLPSPLKPLDEEVGFNCIPNLSSEIVPTNSIKTENCHGLVFQPSSSDRAPIISDTKLHDPTARFLAHNAMDFSGYSLASQSNYTFQHQGLKFVPAVSPMENYCPGPGILLPNPMSSYYDYHQIQQPQSQQQLLHYQPNHSHMYPIYYFPVEQTQSSTPFNLPVQWGVQNTACTPMINSTSVTCKEVISEPTALKRPCEEIKQQSVRIAHEPTDVAASDDGDGGGEVAGSSNEFNDDSVRTLIYKSQPPPPPELPSQFQGKTKASTTLLSDALAQLQMIEIKQ